MYCDIPDFGRCCFCLPLRKGVLVFGYINVVFSAFMIGVYSYFIHHGHNNTMFFKAMTTYYVSTELCLTVYCIELLISCVLVYGTHLKNVKFVQAFYYYTMASALLDLILQIVDLVEIHEIELIIFTFAGLCIQIYLLLLVRSLLKKFKIGSEHTIENQLHNIVLGDPAVNQERIYNDTTMPPVKEDF